MRNEMWTARLRFAAALAALSVATGSAHASDLIWDFNGGSLNDGVSQDGSGTWNTTTPNWVESGNNVNVNWNDATPDSAIFGVSNDGYETTYPYTVTLGTDITVQNITLAPTAATIPNPVVSGDAYYNLAGGGFSLTLNGNVEKSTSFGASRFDVPLALSAGDHSSIINDTANDVAELTLGGVVSGAGDLTVDNGAYQAWGTLALTGANAYTGQTTINKGRLVITDAAGLGATSAGTTIGDLGTLALGGAGVPFANGIAVAEPITITRNTYAGGDYGLYGAAIQSNGNDNVITGPLTLNTSDARIAVNGGSLTISSDIAATGAVLSKTGGGLLTLTGTNAYTGGTLLLDGTLAFSSDASIGGADSAITFSGGILRVPAGMTTFGTHQVNLNSFAGGLDVATGQTFSVDQAIFGSTFTKRGEGTFDFAPNATSGFSGAIRLEGGTTTLTVGQGLTSDGGNFMIAPGSTAALVNDGASVYSGAGEFWVGDGFGAVGAYTQTAGSTSTNNWFVVGRNQSQGTFTLSGGTVDKNGGGSTEIDAGAGAASTATFSGTSQFNANTGNFIVGSNAGANGTLTIKDSAQLRVAQGEFWVGNGVDDASGRATGVVNIQDNAGVVVDNNWVAIGRAGGNGTVNMTGGSFTKNGGGNFIVADNSIGVFRMLSGMNTLSINAGQLWVGQAGGGNGTLEVGPGATVTVNDWIAVGREGGTGLVNLSGGSITKTGEGNITFAGTTNTLNQTDGTLTNTTSQTWIGEGGATSTYDASGGTANLGVVQVGHNGAGTNTLTVRGTANVTATTVTLGNADSASGTVNLQGGTLTANTIESGAGTGPKAFNFTGGTLAVNTFSFGPLANLGAGRLAPGGNGTVGTTAIGGDYTQGAGATLDVDIAGDGSFDLVNASGAVALAGSLDVDVLDGYTPTDGTTFDVLVAGSTLTGIPTLVGEDAALFGASIVNGNTLRLTAGAGVPEPTAFALVGLAAAAGTLRRRRTTPARPAY